MGDIDVLIPQLKLSKALLFSKQREYYYGLTSADIRTICSYSMPENVEEKKVSEDFHIKKLTKATFGSIDIVTFKGKQYIRKTQPVFIDPNLAELLTTPTTYSPFFNEIDLMKEFTMDEDLKPYVLVYYGHAVTANGGTYLMEFLKGDSVENLCQKRGLTAEEWKFVLSEMEKILNLLHKKGYAFNDVHGGNFFVTMDGTEIKSVVLIDFGLTKRINLEAQMKYQLEKKIYEESRQAGKQAQKAEVVPDIPEFNFRHYDITKAEMVEKFKCGKGIHNENFSIQGKPRDYTVLQQVKGNEAQELRDLEAEIEKVTKQVAKLQLTVTRMTQTQAKMPGLYTSTVRSAFRSKNVKSMKNALRSLIPKFTLKGGKRRQKRKTRRNKA